MKKNNLNKALVILLFIIWGVLIYKYLLPNNKENIDFFEIASKNRSNTYSSFKKDTFKLNINNKDPFLGVPIPKVKSIIKKQKKVVKNISSYKKSKVWPKIKYLGFVKSNNSKFKLGLIKINDTLHKVHDGEELKILDVLKIGEDSIKLRYSNQTKYFKR